MCYEQHNDITIKEGGRLPLPLKREKQGQYILLLSPDLANTITFHTFNICGQRKLRKKTRRIPTGGRKRSSH